MANRLFRRQARAFLAWRADLDDVVIAFSRAQLRSVFDERPPRPPAPPADDSRRAHVAHMLQQARRAKRINMGRPGK